MQIRQAKNPTFDISTICSSCVPSPPDIVRQRCPCFCPETNFQQKKCFYRFPNKTVADVGTFVVQCFVAVARRATTVNTLTDSCYSSPLCIKVYIAGNPPDLVPPTPLSANSANDYGVQIADRTDVPACLGYPMQVFCSILWRSLPFTREQNCRKRSVGVVSIGGI